MALWARQIPPRADPCVKPIVSPEDEEDGVLDDVVHQGGDVHRVGLGDGLDVCLRGTQVKPLLELEGGEFSVVLHI